MGTKPDMITKFLNLFRKPAVKTVNHDSPKVGEWWRINDGSPFTPKSFAEVMEVKAGWVRYRIMVPGYDPLPLLSDGSASIKQFVRIYKLHDRDRSR